MYDSKVQLISKSRLSSLVHTTGKPLSSFICRLYSKVQLRIVRPIKAEILNDTHLKIETFEFGGYNRKNAFKFHLSALLKSSVNFKIETFEFGAQQKKRFQISFVGSIKSSVKNRPADKSRNLERHPFQNHSIMFFFR